MSGGTDFDGLIVLDKPHGVTSREAVNQAHRWFPRRTRIGHAGTLDPLATGVLVLCVGKATRFVEFVQDMGKTYETRFRLGWISHSDDGEGPLEPCEHAVDPGLDRLHAELDRFLGSIQQTPPSFSAAMVDGQRAHERARQGEKVELASRTVRIERIEVLGYRYPDLDLRVECGKGTYIRSLARDLGRSLGTGAYVESLRRTRVGPFLASEGISPETYRLEARQHLLPWDRALAELPRVVVPADKETWLLRGHPIACPEGFSGERVALYSEAGSLLAVGEVRGERIQPRKVVS